MVVVRSPKGGGGGPSLGDHPPGGGGAPSSLGWGTTRGGKGYSSWMLPADLAVQGVNGAWNDDFCCVATIRIVCVGQMATAHANRRTMCVCSPLGTVCSDQFLLDTQLRNTAQQ